MTGRLVRASVLAVVVSGVALAATPDSHARGADLRALGVQSYEPPKAAPPLALPDLDGKIARLEDFRGKVVLIFFWATW